MQTLLTTEEIYSHAAADGARPDPLLTVSEWLTPTEPFPNVPPPNPARGARTALRICARSWIASHLRRLLKPWC